MSLSPASQKNPITAESGFPRHTFGLREAITLIVGIVIGAGIFKTPAVVASMTGNSYCMFIAWAAGGVVSLIGALCYAELATAYPNAGGDYYFLHRAYGRSVSFLFGWARLSVITTGSIALLSFVFGDYMNQVVSLDWFGSGSGTTVYAIGIILILSWVNLKNVRSGMATQTFFTILQILCLLSVVGTSIWLFVTGSPAETVSATVAVLPETTLSDSNFGLAMVFVLLTFGGWNEAAYISAELKANHRNMVKALTFSIFIITALYMLVTWAYWQGLGFRGMIKSHTIAADLMQITFGPAAQKIISLMIAISALTSINATIIVGARTSYAMGRDWPFLHRLGIWDTARDTPANALWVQCIASLLLVAAGGWIGSGFKSMVEFTAPVFWIFFLLAGISLFVLRMKEPETPRPFRVPLYPVVPLLFCTTCAYMLWSSLSYVYDQSLGGINAAWIGVSVLLIGVILLLLVNRISPDQKNETSRF